MSANRNPGIDLPECPPGVIVYGFGSPKPGMASRMEAKMRRRILASRPNLQPLPAKPAWQVASERRAAKLDAIIAADARKNRLRLAELL